MADLRVPLLYLSLHTCSGELRNCPVLTHCLYFHRCKVWTLQLSTRSEAMCACCKRGPAKIKKTETLHSGSCLITGWGVLCQFPGHSCPRPMLCPHFYITTLVVLWIMPPLQPAWSCHLIHCSPPAPSAFCVASDKSISRC